MEHWKSISGYEGLYQVSSFGRILSEEKITSHGHHRKKKIRLLDLDKHGYLNIGLTKQHHQKRYLVSRLVAKAFIPNPLNKPTVNHINGNKLDNRIENLEWATVKEQNNHAESIGLKKYKGSGNPNSKLFESDIIDIKNCLSNKETLKRIADRYRVSIGLICQIKQNRIWKHVC